MQRHAKSPGHLSNTTIDLSAVDRPSGEAQTAQRSSPEHASPDNLSPHPSPHPDQLCPELDSTFLCPDLDPPFPDCPAMGEVNEHDMESVALDPEDFHQ